MRLDALTFEQCERIRQWRNQWMVSLRTPYFLTTEMQAKFHADVVCNPNSPHRYWAIVSDEGEFIGMGGMTYIQWENRIGEISLILDPDKRGKGLGRQAALLILDQAFNYLNLQTVCGECYLCNKAASFWSGIVDDLNGQIVELPNRKFWEGKYYDSLYFSIDREGFNNARLGKQDETI